MSSSSLPPSRPTKETSNRFSQARLSRTQQKRDKASQEKARMRIFKRRQTWEQEQARLNFPVFLRKFCELLLISCLIGPVIAYNLQLGAVESSARFMQNFNQTLQSWNNNAAIDVTSSLYLRFLHDFNYLFEANLPVLELKSTVWLMFGSLLVGLHLTSRFFEWLTGRRVFAEDLSLQKKRWDRRRLVVLCSLVGFMVWSLLSFSPYGWGPVIPSEAPLLPSEFETQTGGSFNAFVAWVQVLVAVLFFICAEDIIRTRRLVYKLLGCMIGLAAVAAVLALMLQARDTYFPFLNAFWVSWGAGEVRNDLGSLIGHNTAISSYLMAPFLIIWAILMSHQGLLRRRYVGLLICLLALFSLVLLMAQSRAAVPILVLMFVFLVVMLARQANLKPPLAYMVGLPLVLVLLLLTQLVQKDINPFYRKSVTLEERVSHLSFSHLQTETRLRILFATFPAVMEKPLTGWGFHSFPYSYPTIQGEYFSRVIEKDKEEGKSFFFAPTPKKSVHAHNEYLQTFFETGLIGFVLAMTALWAILFSGWKVLMRSLRQRHVAIQLGIFSGIVALLLHAAADFPFRVAPLASMLMVLLAIWSAGERLWFIRVPNLEERPLNDTETELREKALFKQEKSITIPKNRLLACAGVGAVVFTVIGILHTLGLQWFSNQLLNNSARQYASFYQLNRQKITPAQRMGVLNSALSRLERAHDLVPLNGETLFQSATIRYYVATELKDMLQEAQNPTDGKPADEKAVKFLATQTMSTLQQSIEELRRSLTEENYHGIYQLLALIYFEAFQVSQGNQEFLKRAFEEQEQAVEMNPGDPNSIVTMIYWYTRFQANNTNGVADMLNRLRIFFGTPDLSQPSLYVDFIFEYILNVMEIGSYEVAYKRMVILQSIDPENPMFKLALANAALMTNRFEEALLLNRSIPIKDNPEARLFRGMVSLRRHRWEEAKQHLAQSKSSLKDLSEAKLDKLNLIEPLLEAASAPASESKKAWNEAVRDIEENPNGSELLLDSARSLFVDFDLPERSVQFFQRYTDLGGKLDHLDKAVFAQAYRAKHRNIIQETKQLILEANSKGVPKSDWPKIESSIIREELKKANQLDSEAISGFNLYGDINRYLFLELNNRILETNAVLGN